MTHHPWKAYLVVQLGPRTMGSDGCHEFTNTYSADRRFIEMVAGGLFVVVALPAVGGAPAAALARAMVPQIWDRHTNHHADMISITSSKHWTNRRAAGGSLGGSQGREGATAAAASCLTSATSERMAPKAFCALARASGS